MEPNRQKELYKQGLATLHASGRRSSGEGAK